ncbi:MAG: hypothetical protein LAP87_11640 [Acidobacteriia bacterium]|nr:hypothetical protein [Terriglobia bacterium]
MKKVLLLMVLVAVARLPVRAQEAYPKAEVFGGFSVLSVGDINGSREQFPGWQGSVAGNFHRNFGIVADFGGHYKTIDGAKVNVFEYLFGPRFSFRKDKATLFGEALLGGVRSSVEGESDNGVLMALGGGVDVKASNRVAIRVFEMDWTPNRINHVWSKKEFRICFGFVFKVGGGA